MVRPVWQMDPPRKVKTTLIVLQTLSFAVVGVLFLIAGNTKFGCAQILLAVVNALVYL